VSRSIHQRIGGPVDADDRATQCRREVQGPAVAGHEKVASREHSGQLDNVCLAHKRDGGMLRVPNQLRGRRLITVAAKDNAPCRRGGVKSGPRLAAS